MIGENPGSRYLISIDSERAACLYSCIISAFQNHRTQHSHLGLEKAMRIGCFSTLERIRANQLGELVGVVSGRGLHRPHLVKHYAVASLRQLPCCF